jgi:uncharacterized protein YgbK (DUF1537 family)
MIVVLADDLSGAAELAGAALSHGLSAEVQTGFVPQSDADVVCVVTDTRSLPADSAARVVAQAVPGILTAQPAWIFKKCDSVLRGPVLAEARAAAKAAGKNRIVILSANPSRQRVIRNGIYHVAGVPLHETAFARDPEHPRLTSRLKELLGADLAGVETPDAESAADIRREAALVDDGTLPVGGVDFFEALLDLRTPAHPVRLQPALATTGYSLLVCGSAASWSQRQKAAVARGIPEFALPHDVEAIVRSLHSANRVLIGIGDGPASHGVGSAALVQRLAETVVGILGKTTLTRVLIEGGATTAAVMKAAGWTRLLACAAPDPGIGVLRPAGAVGPLLFIKPGSYDWPEAIWPGGA